MTRDETLSFLTRYLKAIEEGQGSADFYHADAVFTEHPNRISPNGRVARLGDIKAAAGRGNALLERQTYEIKSAVIEGDRAALCVEWMGVLKMPVQTLEPGDVMRAHFAQFYEFRDGLIWRQSTYDCFEPW